MARQIPLKVLGVDPDPINRRLRQIQVKLRPQLALMERSQDATIPLPEIELLEDEMRDLLKSGSDLFVDYAAQIQAAAAWPKKKPAKPDEPQQPTVDDVIEGAAIMVALKTCAGAVLVVEDKVYETLLAKINAHDGWIIHPNTAEFLTDIREAKKFALSALSPVDAQS